MWQELSSHGVQPFSNLDAALGRKAEVEAALASLCSAIALAAGDRAKAGIERARAIRARPVGGGKSLYECLNQLVHYWYCCAGAAHLLRSGYVDIRTRPTAEDSVSDTNDAFDIVARHPDGVSVVA